MRLGDRLEEGWLALIDTDAGIEDGQHITVDVRARPVECEVVRPPFVAVKTR